jgi:hypothetical protein
VCEHASAFFRFLSPVVVSMMDGAAHTSQSRSFCVGHRLSAVARRAGPLAKSRAMNPNCVVGACVVVIVLQELEQPHPRTTDQHVVQCSSYGVAVTQRRVAGGRSGGTSRSQTCPQSEQHSVSVIAVVSV